MMQAQFLSNRLQVNCAALEAAGVVLSGPLQFALPAGEVNVLCGANGVGKSTLLRALSNSTPALSVLFKPEFGLRDELLVRDHLRSVLEHLRADVHQIDKLLIEVGLADWQYERVGTLSSGQRARLGLCTLLAGHFRLWLLDEPLNALDAEGVAVLAKAVGKHLKQGGLLIMATHVNAEVLTQHLQGVTVNVGWLEQGELRGGFSNAVPSSFEQAQHDPQKKIPFAALLRRDWVLLRANPQALLWGALFHWMVLSFFGIGLGKTNAEFAQVAIWVSLLLALLLGAKDWFDEDHRVGWMRFLWNLDPGNVANYWLVRVLDLALCQIIVLVPVTGLVALQFGLNGNQFFTLVLALAAGIWATAPLLGLISLLVMLTRGGAVLVYLLALPLVVPVLIFGLEASQAADLGRSAVAPLSVLISLGVLMCLVGPVVAKRLVGLIQE